MRHTLIVDADPARADRFLNCLNRRIPIDPDHVVMGRGDGSSIEFSTGESLTSEMLREAESESGCTVLAPPEFEAAFHNNRSIEDLVREQRQFAASFAQDLEDVELPD